MPSTWDSLANRNRRIAVLKKQGILAVFHYLSLHKSEYYQSKHDGRALPHADRYSDCLIRLPLFYELTFQDIDRIVNVLYKLYTYPHHAKAIYYNY